MVPGDVMLWDSMPDVIDIMLEDINRLMFAQRIVEVRHVEAVEEK